MKLRNPKQWEPMEWLLAVLCVGFVCSLCQLVSAGVRLVDVLSRL